MITVGQLKKICKKYDIKVSSKTSYIQSIRYKDIPKTKEYFDRRPKYEIFEFNGGYYNNDSDNLIHFQRYISHGIGYVTAPIFYNQPKDLSNLSDWQIDNFLKSGGIPSKLLNTWSTNRKAINNGKEFEDAIQDFFHRLDIIKKLKTSNDLKTISSNYNDIDLKLQEYTKQMETLRTKYRQMFKKHASLITDFE